MATQLGNIFSTDEKAIAQVDFKLLGSMVESLVIEFDQEKFEQLLSGSISPKSTRQYRKVSSETALKSLRRLLKEKPIHFLTK